jgi:two-component system, LuxR family, sensor kinase FixL
MLGSLPSLRRKRPVVFKCGLAVLSVAVAVLLTSLLEHLMATIPLFYAAVIVSSWYGGRWSGLLSVLLATLAVDYYFVPPSHSFTLSNATVPYLGSFALLALIVSFLSTARQQVEESLRQAHDEMEAKVRDRTADLKQINEKLQAEIAERRRIEGALRERANLIDLTHDTVFVRDMSDVITFWNRGAEEQYGWPSQEAVGRVSHHLLRTDFPAPLSAIMAELTRTRRWEGELVHTRRDGTKVVVASRWALQFEGGNPISLLETNNDITERKRAEEEREQLLAREQATRAEAEAAQHRFRDLVNSIEGIVWEADAVTFKFLFVSKQAEHILGYPIERWQSESTFWKDHIDPDDREWAVNFCAKATAEKRDHDFEYRMIAADGRIVWLRDLVTVVVEDDRPTRLRGVMVDITKRKRADEALRVQASLLDLSHDTVFVRDMNDVITYWNRGAEELYGWKKEEAIGQVSHHFTQTLFPASLEKINEELLRTGRWEGELTHTKRDGTQVVVASRWSLQRDEQERPGAILETNNDITERKRAEEALSKTQTELAYITRVMTMGELAASIAHEINQPLAAVVTNGSACMRWLTRSQPDLKEATDAVQRIIRDGKRASDIIARIRGLLKRTAANRVPLDINEVIQETMALAENEVRRRRVSLRADLAADLPLVLGDRVQLQQVILNLTMNGIEAMSSVGDGSRELLIRTQRDDSDQVLISVTDSGVGLDPKNAEHLFEAFFTTKTEGMGMGLSISRSIIEAHGGRLWATLNAGPGATFQFTVPINSDVEA